MYTALLDLQGVRVLVVGGGRVAAQKLKGLPRAAVVAVVSPALSSGARVQARRLGASVRLRPFRGSDASGKRLVFACTEDPAVNAAAARAARASGAWVCVADDPAKGDFQVPATGRAGRLQFTLSTGGASPAMAKALRREFERQFKRSSVDWLLGVLGKARARLKASPGEKKAVLKAVTSRKALELMLAPSTASRRRALRNMMVVLEGKKPRS